MGSFLRLYIRNVKGWMLGEDVPADRKEKPEAQKSFQQDNKLFNKGRRSISNIVSFHSRSIGRSRRANGGYIGPRISSYAHTHVALSIL